MQDEEFKASVHSIEFEANLGYMERVCQKLRKTPKRSWAFVPPGALTHGGSRGRGWEWECTEVKSTHPSPRAIALVTPVIYPGREG